MIIGRINNNELMEEYIKLISRAMIIANQFKQDLSNSQLVSNVDLVLSKLNKIKDAASNGEVINDIAGITKFIDDWPINASRLAVAVWEVEKFFRERLFDEKTYHQALSKQFEGHKNCTNT